MRLKAQWIAGLIAVSLISALVASLLTAGFLVRGLLGPSRMRWLSLWGGSDPESTLTSDTSDSLVPLPTRQPTVTSRPTPSPSPTPVPTAKPTPRPVTPTPTLPPQNATEVLQLWQTRELVQRIYDEIAPSVVGIRVELPATGSQTARTNEASGLIIDKQGTVVTNADVLAVALDKKGNLLPNARIDILVKGGMQAFKGILTGKDPVTGLALLAIEAAPDVTFTAPRLADDPELKVGQIVLSVGYPDLLDESGGLASGFISGLNRPVILENGITVQMIQADVQIRPICSGGPILNLKGEVIGLSNCSLNRSAYDVTNYIMPVTAMLDIVKSISDAGFVTGRSWLGITILSEVSFRELQRLYRFPDGLYVSSVIENSPAYIADLRKGDVIAEINGEIVEPSMDLSAFLSGQPVGTLLRMRVYRRSESELIDIQVYLQEYHR